MIKISILGYGWLGKAIAERLKHWHARIKASTTTPGKLDSITSAGLQAYLLDLAPDMLCSDLSFFDSDILLINFPPKRRKDIVDFHTKQIESLLPAIEKSPIKKVLFVSSTSVYPNTGTSVDETCTERPQKESGKALLIAEELLKSSAHFDTTIIRFAGLIGADRVPGRFLAGKSDIPHADAPVNLIHQTDCTKIIEQIISKNIWGETFNACMPEHPTRRIFYTAAATKAQLPLPAFTDTPTGLSKIVDSSKLADRLSYSFTYRNPMDIL